MAAPRVIPVLLLDGDRLVKTVGFAAPTYVGDPRNAVKIFNDRGADELLILDIGATPGGRDPNLALLEDIVSEAFMPISFGGGVRSLEIARRVVSCGVEKVVLGTAAVEVPGLVEALSADIGASSTVVCIDHATDWIGRVSVRIRRGKSSLRRAPVEVAREMAVRGAGELIVQSIDRDGQMQGYDCDMIRAVADAVSVPIIACGGAASVDDLARAVAAGASAAAAGSLFVFRPPHRAVLISYPGQADLDRILNRQW